MLGFGWIPWWGTLCISLGCAAITAVLVWLFVCPYLKKKMKREPIVNTDMCVCVYICVNACTAVCCVLGGTAEFPSATPLMEKTSREPVAQPSPHREPRPRTPAADTQRVAFKLGGSEETDLDNSDVESKETDVNSKNFLLFSSSESYFSQVPFRFLQFCYSV